MARTAAPFRQTELEHKELRGLTKELRGRLKEAPAGSGGEAACYWEQISGRILELRDRLILHFAQEERTGLADLFSDLQPHIADRSESLRAEHGRILRELKDLHAATLLHAGPAAPQGPDLRKWVLDVLSHLARHEEKETELIQRAYLEELGAGD